jgi:hypothetical protein
VSVIESSTPHQLFIRNWISTISIIGAFDTNINKFVQVYNFAPSSKENAAKADEIV